jgi:hypothetical protein
MHILKQLAGYFENKSKPFLLAVNISLLFVVGLTDFVTGYEIGISLFYLIPISFASWFGSKNQGILVSSLSILTLAVADIMAGKEAHHILIELWNLLMHLGFFVTYAVVLSVVRADLNERRRLVDELRIALSEVKQLSGFLPICASCKKIRDDEGYWNQIESYISSHSEVQFSHGICPDCVKQMYPDVADEILPKKK